MRMKRSQFKSLVKECLREILEEDLLMQRAVRGTVYEGMGQPMVSQVPQVPGFINPMDDQAMVMRHNAMMHSHALARQSNAMNHRQMVPPASHGAAYDYSQMAGLDEDDVSEGSVKMSRDPNRKTPGTKNPLDYLALAVDPRRDRDGRPPYDPKLDREVSVGGRRFIPGGPTQQPQRRLPPPQPRQQVHEDSVGSLSPEVLREIYSDTYQGTYFKQAAAGHTSPGHLRGGQGGMSIDGVGDRFDLAVAGSNDPSELFGGSAMNWSSLAFGGK